MFKHCIVIGMGRGAMLIEMARERNREWRLGERKVVRGKRDQSIKMAQKRKCVNP